jgi:hypothetical protein
MRSIPWTGPPILDAFAVHAEYGHLLLLTENGTLHGFNLDTQARVELCVLVLPEIEPGDEDGYFGVQKLRLHASSDGAYAAIVVDKGRKGVVVDTASGAITMHLDGGDYHEETVAFSACFLCFEGRQVLVHRTDWNRLDAADPATGRSLTDRHIAPYEDSGKRPEHYLDYFHGQLRLAPDGNRIFDDGWVWHPVSAPRTWSVANWLGGNSWECDDGASVVYCGARDNWNAPACWVDDRHIAIWEAAEWDGEEREEIGQVAGVRILDVMKEADAQAVRWPMGGDEKNATGLFSDGTYLYVATDTGTTVWDLASRSRIADLPGFTARIHDAARSTLLAFGPATIVELPLPWRVPQS